MLFQNKLKNRLSKDWRFFCSFFLPLITQIITNYLWDFVWWVQGNFKESAETGCQPERSRRLSHLKGLRLRSAWHPLTGNIYTQLSSWAKSKAYWNEMGFDFAQPEKSINPISSLSSKNQNDRFRLKLKSCFYFFLLDDAIQFHYD